MGGLAARGDTLNSHEEKPYQLRPKIGENGLFWWPFLSDFTGEKFADFVGVKNHRILSDFFEKTLGGGCFFLLGRFFWGEIMVKFWEDLFLGEVLVSYYGF